MDKKKSFSLQDKVLWYAI